MPTHIIMWCAHRRQRPADKINHALLLGGAQGTSTCTGDALDEVPPTDRALDGFEQRVLADAVASMVS
jgi:hypothetical protein